MRLMFWAVPGLLLLLAVAGWFFGVLTAGAAALVALVGCAVLIIGDDQ